MNINISEGLLRKAQIAFETASTGNVRLSDEDVVSAGLAVLIGQCQGKTIPVEQVQQHVYKAIAHGLAQAFASMGHSVEGVSLSAEGYVVHLKDAPDLEFTTESTPIPAPFENAFREENDQ